MRILSSLAGNRKPRVLAIANRHSLPYSRECGGVGATANSSAFSLWCISPGHSWRAP